MKHSFSEFFKYLFIASVFLCEFQGYAQLDSLRVSGLENQLDKKDQLKSVILEIVNEHGYEQDTFNRRYRASFEGDFLRLVVLRKSGEPCNKGILYNLGKVFQFSNLDQRSDTLAYVGVWTSILKRAEKNKWDKHKLVMRFSNLERARALDAALREYHGLLNI